ncbi:hypothetical protein CPLU01_07683 [Colletotrichum plurivorum]|uniref:Uncharacterized protein n=1 Tax=Colletotrichum plurivorum TaxID=2175906 RepID=A0A8H6NDT7_9PEZI|nr:hypothetical protein CPLU01_07683 [Colletotrichum plurivorum]
MALGPLFLEAKLPEDTFPSSPRAVELCAAACHHQALRSLSDRTLGDAMRAEVARAAPAPESSHGFFAQLRAAAALETVSYACNRMDTPQGIPVRV